MKHLKTFEILEKEKKIHLATLYLEENQPISTDEGFIECLYDEPDEISFYFKNFTSDETLEKFYNFLKTNELKIKSENFNRKSFQSFETNETYIEINITISNYKIRKYAELYNNIKKYNL